MADTWFLKVLQPTGKEKKSVGPKSVRSSATLHRLSVHSDSASIRWGWSRSETERLVRMQAVTRGWLLRRKVCHIPARDVDAVLKDLHQKDKGLGRLVGYLCFFLLFFSVYLLESDVTFQNTVETSLQDLITQIGAGPDDLRLSEIGTREEFSAWAISLYRNMYRGNELENPCNTCADVRVSGMFRFLSEVDPSLWGTDVPLGDAEYKGSRWTSFDFDSCPVCFGPNRTAVVEASPEGEQLCGFVCSDMEWCFEGACAEYDSPAVTTADVVGTNNSMVLVSSNEDCPITFGGKQYLIGYGKNIGLTSVIADQPNAFPAEGVIQPVGSGYVANKNRILGAILTEWTYYEEAVCEDQLRPRFYRTCYKDSGSKKNKSEEVKEALMNDLGTLDVNEGSENEGMVYSVTTDAGVYNVGLNFGLCDFMGIFGGVDVITSAVRTVSLKFNTFNGQKEGLFSSVDITAKFSLGGEVKIEPQVRVFSMPPFFSSNSLVVGRAVAMFLFAISLVYFVVKDFRHLMRELMDGRRRLKISFRRIPITTATIVHLLSDAVFVGCLALWIKMAAFADDFELSPIMSFSDPSKQVRELNECLEIAASDRWRRDALAVAGSIMGLARLFLMLRFHPRLSLVTDVLAASMVHLVHFFIMFFMVVTVYSNIGWILFGPSSDLFATWALSFITMTRIALGEFDSIYPGMVEINPMASFVIIATYQTLQFVLLLNIVVSILLDAFQMVQSRNTAQATDTLGQTVMTTIGRWRIYVADTLFGRAHPGSSSSPHFTLWSRATKNPMYRLRDAEHRSANTMLTSSSITDAATAGGLNAQNRTIGNPPSPSSVRRRSSLSSRPGSASSGLSAAVLANRQTANDRNFKGSAKKMGMTRAERIAATHRHYDMRTAAEVLRRSPLPEGAVWRKMRQIIGTRLEWMPLEGGGWD